MNFNIIKLHLLTILLMASVSDMTEKQLHVDQYKQPSSCLKHLSQSASENECSFIK